MRRSSWRIAIASIIFCITGFNPTVGFADEITVNGTSAIDADFNDTTPAEPADAVNVMWQIDPNTTPDSISAYLPLNAMLDANGSASNFSGLELADDGLALLQNCDGTNNILKWNDSSGKWECKPDFTAANSIGATELEATITFVEGDVLDFGSVVPDSTSGDGIILPTEAGACTNATAEGQICWDSSNQDLYVGDGSASPVKIGLPRLDEVLDPIGAKTFLHSADETLTFNFASTGSNDLFVIKDDGASATTGNLLLLDLDNGAGSMNLLKVQGNPDTDFITIDESIDLFASGNARIYATNVSNTAGLTVGDTNKIVLPTITGGQTEGLQFGLNNGCDGLETAGTACYDSTDDKFCINEDGGSTWDCIDLDAGNTSEWTNSAALYTMNDTGDELVIGAGVLSDGGVDAKVSIDGDFDQPQLIIQAFSTQTDPVFLIEGSGGTKRFAIDENGTIRTKGNIETFGGTQLDIGLDGGGGTTRIRFFTNGAGGDAEIQFEDDSIGAAEIDKAQTFAWTGTQDFSSVTSFLLPTNFSVDASGESSWDTTAVPATGGEGSLQLHDGSSGALSLPLVQHSCILIENLAATDDNFPLWTPPYAITIKAAYCECHGTCTTEADIHFEKDSGGTITQIGGTTTTGDVTCEDTTTGDSITALTSGTVTLGALDTLRLDVLNTPGPQTDKYSICWTYTVDPT